MGVVTLGATAVGVVSSGASSRTSTTSTSSVRSDGACVAGTRLPGPGAIYIDQQLRFKAPVRIGDTVTATCTVTEVNTERRRVKMDTVCTVKGKPVVEGNATFMVDARSQP